MQTTELIALIQQLQSTQAESQTGNKKRHFIEYA